MMGNLLLENDGSWSGVSFWLDLALLPAVVLDSSVAWLLGVPPAYLAEQASTRALMPLIAVPARIGLRYPVDLSRPYFPRSVVELASNCADWRRARRPPEPAAPWLRHPLVGPAARLAG